MIDGVTSIVPLKLTSGTHAPPDVVTVYANDPDTVGVPDIVNTPPANEPYTPAGKAPADISALVAPPPIV